MRPATARPVTVLAIAVMTAALGIGPAWIGLAAAGTDGLAGTAGTDTALANTDSALTLPGRGLFSDLRVAVNQTQHLTNQAISVTWTGGRPSQGFNANWLQIFQCWGDDDGAHPENPGPPPEQCEFGGEPFTSITSKIPADARASNVYSRAIANDNWSTFEPPPSPCSAPCTTSQGVYDPATGKLWKPFRSVDGEVYDIQLKSHQTIENGNSSVTVEWLNKRFDFTTSNEDDWAKTYGNGTGSELFQVATGQEAPGLGCGKHVLTRPDGTTATPKCWLVVVPRGTPAEENPTSHQGSDFPNVIVPPIAPSAWQNRIAFPLDFNPADTACSIEAKQRPIAGGELAAPAAINWQPTLCAQPGAATYAYGITTDDVARQQLLRGDIGMAVTTEPVDPTRVDPDNPVTYAPVALSGVVVGFNVERVPTDNNGAVVDPAEEPIAGSRVTHLNLTPRLVAKLLTSSYWQQFPAIDRNNLPSGYEWTAGNQPQMFADPDFLQFNPEFTVMSVGSAKTASGLVVEGRTTDAAVALWRWILADPEAKAWLAGAPDAWGMRVNPLFNTDGAHNPSGAAFGDPVPNNFPKNDPYCYQAPSDGGITPRPLCLLDAEPYAPNMSRAAQATRAANDGASTTHDPASGSQQSANTYWGADGPQRQGSRSILSVTDAASAVRFGLQSASLSRAGDDQSGRAFVAPDTAGLVAGQKAMVPSAVAGVLHTDPTTSASGAYPLTTLMYAATTPRSLEADARRDYAAFVTYAADAGQASGVAFGQLPLGYAPLPAELRAQAAAAAVKIAAGDPAPPELTPAPVADVTAAPTPTVEATTVSAGVAPGAAFGPAATLLPGAAPDIPLPAANAGSAFPGGTTPKGVLGFIRFTMPIVVGVGLMAILIVLILDDRRLYARAAALRVTTR